MAETVAIAGPSGHGKTFSMRNLNHETNFIVMSIAKTLPWRNSRKQYNANNKNLFISTDYGSVFAGLKKISDEMPHIKSVVIDDSQFFMADEFMLRGGETGFGKFFEIGAKYYHLIKEAKKLREDLIVYFLCHTEVEDGITKMKTVGKMLDEKVTVEALFTIVLRAQKDENGYKFITNSRSINDRIKSPFEMFSSDAIDNDLNEVDKIIREYYGYEEE